MLGLTQLMGLDPVQGAEQVGIAVRIIPSVRGNGSELHKDSAIHRDEKITATASGVGEFVFDDGSKLAVGPNSTVVVDAFVYADTGTVKKLAINSAKGTFRWISGRSHPSAYKIQTPVGTLGVRGTAFDAYAGGGRMAVLLFNGQASVCGRNGGCRFLKQNCDAAVVDGNGVRGVAKAKPGRNVVDGVSNARAFPFATGSRRLSRGFRARGGGCLSNVNALLTVLEKGGGGEAPVDGRSRPGGGDNENGPL